jgi:nucleoside-diphosphate-sugar epimerase
MARLLASRRQFGLFQIPMKVLITGATGFIGGAVARLAVERGHQVTALCRERPKDGRGIRWGTIDELTSRAEPQDVVIHVAALRHRHGVPHEEYARNNLELTTRVIDLAKKSKVARFVDVSSIAVYGWPEREKLPIDETFPNAPVGPYGRSKIACEDKVIASGLPYTIVQPSITYGPGDTNGMVEKMLRMIAKGFFVVPGLGSTRVQLVYIDDLARIILLAAQSETTLGQRFIATYKDPIAVRTLVGLLADAVGRKILPVGPPKSVLRAGARVFEALDAAKLWRGEPPLTREKLDTISVDRAYRIDRMRSLLGTEPHVGYVEGIRRTAEALGLYRKS